MTPKPKPPPDHTNTHCTSCGTQFEKYEDLVNDPYPSGIRIFYWCERCDGSKEAK